MGNHFKLRAMIIALIFILYFFSFSLHSESEYCCPLKDVGVPSSTLHPPMVKIHNELTDETGTVNGTIKYTKGKTINYSVKRGDTSKNASIPDQSLMEITGTREDTGKGCTPYKPGQGTLSLEFRIVDGKKEGECIILPAIQTTTTATTPTS